MTPLALARLTRAAADRGDAEAHATADRELRRAVRYDGDAYARVLAEARDYAADESVSVEARGLGRRL